MQIKPSNPQKEQTKSIKEKLWEEFEKQSEAVLTLAYMYARGYELTDEDITKEWTNAVQNNAIVERVYQKGYQDALKDIEEKKRRDFYHKVIVDLEVGGKE